MYFYTDKELSGEYRLLLGTDGTGEKVIFSHVFLGQEELEQLIQRESGYFPGLEKNSSVTAAVCNMIDAFLANGMDPCAVDVVYSRGTEFQKKIWQTLRQVARGEVITYGDLAGRSGYPGAQQAVGQAMKNNYLVLFVPCHRVVAAGGLGGFSAGVNLKKWLLKIENPHQSFFQEDA